MSFVFVDDGSSDGTCALLKSFAGGREGRVAVISNPHNDGKAEAVRTGVLMHCMMGQPIASDLWTLIWRLRLERWTTFLTAAQSSQWHRWFLHQGL